MAVRNALSYQPQRAVLAEFLFPCAVLSLNAVFNQAE